MSYVFPFKERGESMASYFSKPNVPSLASETALDIEAKYFSKYGKEKKLYKAYDGIMGEPVFYVLKKMSKRYPNNKKIRRALIDAIKDKKLTKAFYNPDLLFQTLEGFYTPDSRSRVNDPYFKMAVNKLREMIIPDQKLKPSIIHSGMDVRENLTTINTSAGIGNYGKKKKHVLNYMITKGLELKQEIASGKPLSKIKTLPYIAITRSQLGTLAKDNMYIAPLDEDGNYKYKGRLVWCEDAAMVLFESQYARPAINYLAEAWPNIAMGKAPDKLRSHLCLMSESMHYWYSSDYEKYDSTLPAWLLRTAFDLIKEMFDEQYHREIDFICKEFVHAAILMPDKQVYTVNKGVKSGSYFTQIIGSICNALIMFTFLFHKFEKHDKQDGVSLETNMTMPDGNLACSFMGDDGVIALQVSVDTKAMSDYVKCVFGVVINPSKTTKGRKGQPIEYLKRSWTRDGEWRDPADILIHLMHPERRRLYKNYSPWHILFGMWMTYRVAFEEMGFSGRYIVSKMKETPFGVEALENVEREELPGALAALKYTDFDTYQAMVDAAIEFAAAEEDYAELWEESV